jgi:predicted PurR-regulated permease PerM
MLGRKLIIVAAALAARGEPRGRQDLHRGGPRRQRAGLRHPHGALWRRAAAQGPLRIYQNQCSPVSRNESALSQERDKPAPTEMLRIGACIVIIMAGIKAASEILVLVLMALLISYSLLPQTLWLARRLKIGKGLAVAATLVFFATSNLALLALLYGTCLKIWSRLPEYSDRFMTLYAGGAGLLASWGLEPSRFSISKSLTPEVILAFTHEALPGVTQFFGDSVLVSILSWVFLVIMTEEPAAKSRLGQRLAVYSDDVLTYIEITSVTGLITAVANLLLLWFLGVEYPLIWAVIYYFLHFIPNLGFIAALLPPTLLTLLTVGWQKAAAVAAGLIVTQTLSDYLLTPMLLKKGANVSMLEITLSLMFWTFLLGPAGSILAIPLTLVFKRLIVTIPHEA